ncbi:MAG: hypothetical protein GC203_08980 [Phenylobacterium sp.]|uniref:EF-hand domain-containing protein n=1 Tax=Phenylobacterium sp. TaxID=1871053 RepID=UPI0025F92D49|nr:EF-hand domain-containing protein [Phenylobacterium sp.]MBI1197985.1 hypothetical protein [Phenylobacterium sp.]
MRITTGVAAALGLIVAACAGGPAGPGGHGRGGGPGMGMGMRGGPPPGGFGDEDGEEHRGPRMQLFISPSGQPFRAPPGQPYPVAAWFAQADADHDGRLTRDEFRADADAWFKQLDVNGDGQIDMRETTRWEEEVVPEVTRMSAMGGMGPGGGRGPGRGGRGDGGLDTRRQGAAAFSLINEPQPIRGADTDYSLSVSRKEWRGAADRRFALLDVDGDGVLLLTELRPTPAQSMMRPGAGQDPDGRGKRRGPPPR